MRMNLVPLLPIKLFAVVILGMLCEYHLFPRNPWCCFWWI